MTVNANRKSLLAQVDKRWVGASLAAAGAIVAADKANAAIVYHAPAGGVNIPSDFYGVYLNLDNEAGGTGATGNASTPGWDINPYGSTYLTIYFDSTSAALRDSAAGWSNLAAGSPICPADTYGQLGSADASVVLNGSNLLGMKFVDGGGTTRYGWIRLALGATFGAQPRTIIDWAYENDPAACIGAGVAPEPGSLALLAAGVAGLVMRRRRSA